MRSLLVVVLGALLLPGGAALRVVTYNIHAWRTPDHNDNFADLVDVLAALRPDVLCLNEVLEPWSPPSADDPYWATVASRRGYAYDQLPPSCTHASVTSHLRRLAAALGLDHVHYTMANDKGFFGRVPFGNAILSRYPFESTPMELLMRPHLPADLSLGDQPRTTDDLEPRSAIFARVMLPAADERAAATFGVCVTHLDHKAEELRERQVREVLAAARANFASRTSEHEHVPFCICGDLNSYDRRDTDDEQWAQLVGTCEARGWPPPREASLVRRVLEQEGGMVDAYDSFANNEDLRRSSQSMPRPPPTAWTGVRLDYIMLHGGVRATAQPMTVEGAPCSDHKPVVCELRVER